MLCVSHGDYEDGEVQECGFLALTITEMVYSQ